MRKKLKLLFLRFELYIQIINSKLPRLFRITKYGLITTAISLCIAIPFGVVNAQTDISDTNLGRWTEEGQVPAMLSAWYHVANGRVTQSDTEANAYVIEGSALVAANNIVVEVFEQTDQVSGVRYIADTLDKAGITQGAYAQSTGYQTFQPVLELWKIVRDLALGFIVVIGFILAFMILLRVQQGQAYVTIMNALPKLIVSIVLIIFSYSLGGLLIDLGNVSQKLIVSVFWRGDFIEADFQQHINPNTQYPYNIFGPVSPGYGQEDIGDNDRESSERDLNIFRLISRFTEFETWGKRPCEAGETAPWWWKDTDCPLRISDIIRTPTNIGLLDGGINLTEEMPSEVLIKLILTIVIITGVLKIFFALLKAFSKMIIYTIFAPIVFLLYPLSPQVVLEWLRYFLAESLLFPGAFLMMFLAAIIVGDPNAPWYTQQAGTSVGAIAPDLLLYSVDVDLETGSPFLTKMTALTIILMIPALPEFLYQQLKVVENLMVTRAKESVQRVASKVPFIGGMIGNL